MRNLLNFLLRYSSWFLFAFYVVVSCGLLFNRNPYQHHVYMTSAGAIAGGLHDISSNITGYFSLRDINDDLQRQTAELQAEVLTLREQVRRYREDELQDSLRQVDSIGRFDFIIATVINNSISRPYNYVTINKGRLDGIRPEMGVMDQNGVVGVVNVVSDHYARIISLLNPNFRLSCKLRGSDTFGSLVWDGNDPTSAILEELPKHTIFHEGDTIVTSGFSAVFPEGLPVGIISGTARGADDNFFTLKIKLLTDLTALSTVKIISNTDLDEIRSVENDATSKSDN
ncbi:MAG: rod shape-determining protein MreC [Muribaculaceae bacterium]|nr:rod shape-determining protein MreC [Muribaculaceae bacterium]